MPGVRLVKSFEVSRTGYEVVMTARMIGPNAAAFMSGRRLTLELGAGRGLAPPPAAGFAAMLERMSRVIVTGRVRTVRDDSREPRTLRPGDWVGFRSRFWALLVRSDGAGDLEAQPGANAPLALTEERGRLSWRDTFYAGPLEHATLTRADPRLGRLLFSGLWFWLRPLSFGLLFLLRGLTELIGHPGFAIIALGGVGQDPLASAHPRGRAAAGAGERHAGARSSPASMRSRPRTAGRSARGARSRSTASTAFTRSTP